MAIMDAEGRIQWVSPAVKRVLGVEPDELVGQLGSDLCHPDDYERVVQEFIELIQDPSRDTLRTESRSLHRNGSWIWVDSIIMNRLDDPDVRGIVTNFRDITERVEA